LDDYVLKECTCIAAMQYDMNITTINNPFFKEDITSQFGPNPKCTKENRDLCKTKCDGIMKEISNNYDLTKVPKNVGIQESLGQYICDKIGKDVNYKNVNAGAEYYCYKDEDNYSTGYERTDPLVEEICCEKAKFVEKCTYDPNKDEDWQKLMNSTLAPTTTKF